MEKQTEMQTLTIENRTHTRITGVTEVLTVTEKGTVVKLMTGVMQIFGSGLKVEKLSPEEKLLVLSGTINKVEYLEASAPKGFFKRLFK